MTIFATNAPAHAQPDITHFTLANGMEVVVIPDHRAPVVTHMVWYRVGAADEPPGSAGIAHFLEHLMFKGTEKIAPQEFSKIVAANGGQDNAFTTQDATAYFQRIAKDRLPLVMGMEADRMVNLRLDEKNVRTERDVVLEERRSRVDNDPASILNEQMNAALYVAHPYGTPVIGWEPEIKELDRTDALSFYKRFYAPNNAILVVAGDVTQEEVRKLAEEAYGKIPRRPDVGLKPRITEPDPAVARRVILTDSRVGQATLYRYYLAPSFASAPPREAEALDLLMQILGSNATGRIYKALVVQGKIASAAGGWYSGSARDYGQAGAYAVAADGVSLEKVEAAIDEVIADIAENGVTQAELDRARNGEIADLVYKNDSQSAMARTYGYALVTGRTIADVKERPERLGAVTLADVQAAARKYLQSRRSVTGLLIPKPAKVAAQMGAGPQRPPVPGGESVN